MYIREIKLSITQEGIEYAVLLGWVYDYVGEAEEGKKGKYLPF